MTFHRVHGAATHQAQIFQESGVVDLLEKALAGYSATVFAFGQTSSGKTYTMTGPDIDGPVPPDSQGIIPRSLQYLYERVSAVKEVVRPRWAICIAISNISSPSTIASGHPTVRFTTSRCVTC